MAGDGENEAGETPSTLKENFVEFAEKLGAGMSMFKQSVQEKLEKLDADIRADVKETLHDHYWAREYDKWTQGEILGDTIADGYYNTIYCKASDGEVYYSTPVDYSAETSINTTKTWTFTNYLPTGRYTIDVNLASAWFTMGQGSTHIIWAHLKDEDGNLITQSYISNQGDTGTGNDCRTIGWGDGIGVFDSSEGKEYSFTVSTTMPNSRYYYYGVEIRFSRQF